MKSLFESFRKFALNEEQDQDIKDAVEDKLREEGGAAGIDPLLDAAKEVSQEMTKEELEEFLGELENIGRHVRGDFILDDTDEEVDGKPGVIHVKKEKTLGVELDDDEDDKEDDENLEKEIKEAIQEILDEKRKRSKRKTKKKRSRKKKSSKKKKGKADDRCTRIAKRKYDVWPSAYASGAVVKCRQGKIWKGVSENTDLTLNEEYEELLVKEISQVLSEVMTEKKSLIQKREQAKNQKDLVEDSTQTKTQKTQ